MRPRSSRTSLLTGTSPATSSPSSEATKAPSPCPVSTLAPTPFALAPLATISTPKTHPTRFASTPTSSTAISIADSAAPFQRGMPACAQKSATTRTSRTASRTPPITLRTPSMTDSTSAAAPASSAASNATSMATSAQSAPIAPSPGTIVSNVEISPLPTDLSLPSCPSFISHFADCPSCTISYPHCVRHLCSSSYSSCSLDCAAAYTIPLPPPCSRSFLPSSYLLDILSRASLAMCRLVSICTSDTDCPSSYQLSHFHFVSDRRPHYLIVTLPSCTLRVCSFSDVFLTRFMLRVPPAIQPPPDARPSLMRRF